MANSQASSGQTSSYRTDWPSPLPTTKKEQQDQELRLAQFWVDHAREAACWISSDGLFQYVNNAACRSLGYSRDELLSMSVHDIDPNFPRDSWAEQWNDIKRRGSFTRESQHRAKDGRLFPVEIVVDFLEYEGQEYICALAHDISERKQHEQALRDSEEALRASEVRFRTLAEHSYDVINMFSAEGELLYTSPSITRVLGYEPEELIGTCGPTLLHPDDVAASMAFFEKALQSPGEVDQYVMRLRHKDGSYRTVESTGTNLLDEPGFHAMVSIFHDITEQRQSEEALQRAYDEVEERVQQRTAELAAANRQLRTEVAERKATEQALRESQENLQALFNTLDDFLFVLDLQGRILHANPAAVKGLGYSQEDLRGRAALEFRPSDRREEAAAIMADILAGKANVCHMPLVRKDGTLIHVETKGALGKWGGQDVLFGISRDVSDRRQAERALQAEHTFRGAIVKRAAEGLCVCHEVAEYPFVRFTVWSDRMTEITGYTMDQINRLGWYQTMYPDEEIREAAKERMAAMRTGNDLRGEQWVIRRANGEQRTVLISTSVLDTGNGAKHVLAIMQDITERTRMEQALRHSEEALRRSERLASIGTLAAGIAHEINNPLGAITLSAEIAIASASQPHNDTILQETLDNIQVSARRCSQIVRGVHQFARNKELEKSPGNLGEVIRYARDAAGKLAKKEGIRVEIKLSDDLPQLVMASGEMRQVFTNLILNSVQASQPGSCVTLRSEVAADGVHVLVEDRGCGMSEEELDRIFDPFYTTRGQEGGTGLGLSISHGIVREHGGTIHAQSTPGVGTKMRVVLPLPGAKA